jgi:Protein of unknown function (DUF3179)
VRETLRRHRLAAVAGIFVLAGSLGGLLVAGAVHQSTRGAERPPPFDLSTSHGRALIADFSPDDLVGGAGRGSIPAITRPRFDSAAVASRSLRGTDLVLGVAFGGDARAYPVKLLALHEVVDDVVDGRPIAVTWCPLCASALVFDRRIAGRVLTFDVSGFLYRANQVLFDRETRSLWSQLADGAVTGKFRGAKLRTVPGIEQPWRTWRSAHPRTRVLSIRHDIFASRFTHPYSFVDARGVESSDDPYAGYVRKVPIYYGNKIDGISGATRVVGIELHGRTKAYPEELLARRHVIDDTLAGVRFTIFWNGFENTAAVFSRRVKGRSLHFRWQRGIVRDRATGSRWNPESGRAVAGKLAGTALRPLAFTFPYWFAWHSFHPQTALARP